MKEALIIDLTGAVIEVELVDDGAPEVEAITEQDDVTEEYIVVGYKTTKRVPEGTFKPMWDFMLGDWVEGLSKAEIDALRNAVVPLTSDEKIGLLEGDNSMLLMELAVTQANLASAKLRLDGSEQIQADLLFELAMKGVL